MPALAVSYAIVWVGDQTSRADEGGGGHGLGGGGGGRVTTERRDSS